MTKDFLNEMTEDSQTVTEQQFLFEKYEKLEQELADAKLVVTTMFEEIQGIVVDQVVLSNQNKYLLQILSNFLPQDQLAIVTETYSNIEATVKSAIKEQKGQKIED